MGERADLFTVGQHFTGKSPRVREVYDRLLALLEKIGPVREDPKKTSIHLVRQSALAGVEVRKEYLVLNVKTDYPIESARVARGEQISAGRYHHQFKLSSPKELDAEIGRWLKDAWELSG